MRFKFLYDQKTIPMSVETVGTYVCVYVLRAYGLMTCTYSIFHKSYVGTFCNMLHWTTLPQPALLEPKWKLKYVCWLELLTKSYVRGFSEHEIYKMYSIWLGTMSSLKSRNLSSLLPSVVSVFLPSKILYPLIYPSDVYFNMKKNVGKHIN
jgi:hypothetical protein